VRIARQNERVDTGIAQLQQFAAHLVGVAHNGNAGPTAGSTNASPQVLLEIAVVIG
jgi:hypothetical protein